MLNVRFLYHYSAKRFPTMDIFTGRALGTGTSESVSFLFAPPPFPDIATAFLRDHIWGRGKTIFEYKVPVMAPYIFPTTQAEVLETPELTALADKYWIARKETDPTFLEEYKKREEAVIEKTGLRGVGLVFVTRMHDKYAAMSNDHFRSLILRSDFAGDLNRYYAATVPHISLTPSEGKIRAFSVNKIQL